MADQWSDPISVGLADKRPPPRKQEAGAIIVPVVQSPSSWAKCRECRGTFSEGELTDGLCEACGDEQKEEAEATPEKEPPKREEVRQLREVRRDPEARVEPRADLQRGVSSLRAELRVLERLASDLERLDPGARKRVAAWLAAWLSE